MSLRVLVKASTDDLVAYWFKPSIAHRDETRLSAAETQCERRFRFGQHFHCVSTGPSPAFE